MPPEKKERSPELKGQESSRTRINQKSSRNIMATNQINQKAGNISKEQSLKEMEEYIERLRNFEEIREQEEQEFRITEKIHNKFLSIGDLARDKNVKRRFNFKDAYYIEFQRQEENNKMSNNRKFLLMHRQHLKERQEKGRKIREKIAEELLKKEKSDLMEAKERYLILSQKNQSRVMAIKKEQLQTAKMLVGLAEEVLEDQNQRFNKEIEDLEAILAEKVKYNKKDIGTHRSSSNETERSPGLNSSMRS